MRITKMIAAGGLLVAACNPGEPCSDHAECTKGAKCWCDKAGRLIYEDRDLTGDKVMDRIAYRRDASGRVISISQDWSDNGKIDRYLEFTYDAEGRRISNVGWQLKCGTDKFHWSCTYDTPCPPPYDNCGSCPANFRKEKEDGSIQPCIEPKTASSAKP